MNTEHLAFSLFHHPRQSSAGIHPKKRPDGCPIKNVEHDAGWWRHPKHDVENDRDSYRFSMTVILREAKDLAEPWDFSTWAQILRRWLRMTGWLKATAGYKVFVQ
jgi:hypothetical protein